MNPPDGGVAITDLGVADAAEIREAIAAFLGAGPCGPSLALTSEGDLLVSIGGRESRVRAAPASLPLAGGVLSRILCVDGLRQLGDPEPFLGEACRVLAPGGGLLSIAIEPAPRAVRGFLVKTGFAWSESYEVITVERVTPESDLVETKVFATSGWISGP